MTEGNISELMLEVAWKGIEETKQITYKIDEKANNITTLSAVLMTIVSGVLVGLIDKTYPVFKIFLIVELILLFISMCYAMKAIWLRKQDVLDVMKSIKKVDTEDYSQSNEDLAVSIAGWQIEAKKVYETKKNDLKKSMICLVIALSLGLFIVIIITILEVIPYFSSLL